MKNERRLHFPKFCWFYQLLNLCPFILCWIKENEKKWKIRRMDLAFLPLFFFFCCWLSSPLSFHPLFPCTKKCIQVGEVAFRNGAIRPSKVSQDDIIQMNSAFLSWWVIVLLCFCWLFFLSCTWSKFRGWWALELVVCFHSSTWHPILIQIELFLDSRICYEVQPASCQCRV